MGEQKFDQGQLAGECCAMQRRLEGSIEGVDIRTGLKQQANACVALGRAGAIVQGKNSCKSCPR